MNRRRPATTTATRTTGELFAAATRTVATVSLGLAALLSQTGCNGCSEKEPKASTPSAAPATAAAATTAAAPKAAPTEAPAAAPAAAAPRAAPAEQPAGEKPAYRGPTSTNPTGYTITTGFTNEQGESVAQPAALETTTAFITVLAPKEVPVGMFDQLAEAEMHGFLLARDMRHAHYTFTSGPVAEGADARKMAFAPREGGDHALIAVFKPVGKDAQAVSTPIVFSGALPKIAGPGVAGLSTQSRVKGGDIRLQLTPKTPKVGETITLSAQRLDNTGAVKATERLKFVAIFDDAMGGGEVVPFSAAGTAQWTPSAAGDWLVLAPPPEGKVPLTFKITVAAKEEPHDGATADAPAPTPAKP